MAERSTSAGGQAETDLPVARVVRRRPGRAAPLEKAAEATRQAQAILLIPQVRDPVAAVLGKTLGLGARSRPNRGTISQARSTMRPAIPRRQLSTMTPPAIATMLGSTRHSGKSRARESLTIPSHPTAMLSCVRFLSGRASLPLSRACGRQAGRRNCSHEAPQNANPDAALDSLAIDPNSRTHRDVRVP